MDEFVDPRRNLNLDSVQNLRDLGGYSTKDGRKTKWGAFLRSGDMSAMTEDDQEALLRQVVRSVIDLRMAKEIAIAPNVFSGSKQVTFSIMTSGELVLMTTAQNGKRQRRKKNWPTFIVVVSRLTDSLLPR